MDQRIRLYDVYKVETIGKISMTLLFPAKVSQFNSAGHLRHVYRRCVFVCEWTSRQKRKSVSVGIF